MRTEAELRKMKEAKENELLKLQKNGSLHIGPMWK